MNLEHLYLVGTSLPSIKLAKLKTFDCSYCNIRGDAQEGQKVLDCPELQALAIDWEEIEAPVLKCPKLRYLKYTHYSPWINRLDSLEVLNLREFRMNSGNILTNHPNLHTLNVFNAEKAVLEELVRSKREIRRNNLKIFLSSLPVDGELLKAFDEIFNKASLGYYTAKGVELYTKHEQEFRDDFFLFDEKRDIVINKETIANLKLLTDRTAIFKKIRRVYGLRIENGWSSQEELIDLMRKMPNVQCLSCNGVALDQALFDQLPTTLEFLYELYIYRSMYISDLSFLLKFRELYGFYSYAPSLLPYDRNINKISGEFKKKKALDFDPKLV